MLKRIGYNINEAKGKKMKPKFYFDIQQYIFDPSDRSNYQSDPRWLNLRSDRITASISGDLFVKGKHKTGLGSEIISTLEKRALQKYTGWIDDTSVAYSEKDAIKRGIIYEQEAAEWYEKHTKRSVANCGFVGRGQFLGCSPDRIVLGFDRRLLQIKVPMPQNFMKEVMADGEKHVAQCKTELYVCDYLVNDLLIYSPELKTGYIREIHRDPEHDKTLLSKMRVAVKYQQELYDKIESLLKNN